MLYALSLLCAFWEHGRKWIVGTTILNALGSKVIILGALCFVRQDGVCLCHSLEFLWISTLVGMVLHGELAIRLGYEMRNNNVNNCKTFVKTVKKL